MEVTIARAALVLAPGEQQQVLPLTQPVNDLIGLRTDHEYFAHVVESYLAFWPEHWAKRDARDEPSRLALAGPVDDAIYEWMSAGVPDLFLEAAQQAETGHFLAKLAPLYERVRLRPGDEPGEVPDGDLPALATWALREAMRVRELQLRECPRCGVPWITAAGQPNPYCLRPYPGREMTCRQLEKDDQQRGSHGAWRREYKRLHERKARGKLSDEEWAAWRRENNPDAWLPLEEWRALDPKKAVANAMKAFAAHDPATGAREGTRR